MVQPHTTNPIFFGRQDKRNRFGDLLADPKGHAVFVVGREGMGETLLLNRRANMARDHPDLKCGTFHYEVTKTDDVMGTMAPMIDHAFETAFTCEKFSDIQQDLDKKRKTMTRLWAKREEQIRGVIESTSGMYGDLQGTAEKPLRVIEGLDMRLLEAGGTA